MKSTLIPLIYAHVNVPERPKAVADLTSTHLLMGSKGFAGGTYMRSQEIQRGIVLDHFMVHRAADDERRPADILVLELPAEVWNHQLLVYVQTHIELDLSEPDQLYGSTMDVINGWMLNWRGDRKLDLALFNKVSAALSAVYALLQQEIFQQGNFIRAFHYNDRQPVLVIEHTPESTDVFTP